MKVKVSCLKKLYLSSQAVSSVFVGKVPVHRYLEAKGDLIVVTPCLLKSSFDNNLKGYWYLLLITGSLLSAGLNCCRAICGLLMPAELLDTQVGSSCCVLSKIIIIRSGGTQLPYKMCLRKTPLTLSHLIKTLPSSFLFMISFHKKNGKKKKKDSLFLTGKYLSHGRFLKAAFCKAFCLVICSYFTGSVSIT